MLAVSHVAEVSHAMAMAMAMAIALALALALVVKSGDLEKYVYIAHSFHGNQIVSTQKRHYFT